jgi:hypothetical protein
LGFDAPADAARANGSAATHAAIAMSRITRARAIMRSASSKRF